MDIEIISKKEKRTLIRDVVGGTIVLHSNMFWVKAVHDEGSFLVSLRDGSVLQYLHHEMCIVVEAKVTIFK